MKLTKKQIELLLLIFITGCISGYIYEEIFYFVVDHKLVNSGFLYGPYLPVYGTGAICLFLILRKLKKNPVLIFLLSIIITGIVEYITGYLMFLIWHRTWWDYTGLFLNISGYVCLRSVLTFAIGGLLLIYIIVPILNKLIAKKEKLAIIFIIIFMISFVIDSFITLIYRY